MAARADSIDDLAHSVGDDSGSEQRAEEEWEEEFQVGILPGSMVAYLCLLLSG